MIKDSSGYAQHMLNTGHVFVTMEDMSDLIIIQRNGKFLSSFEKYNIFKVSK